MGLYDVVYFVSGYKKFFNKEFLDAPFDLAEFFEKFENTEHQFYFDCNMSEFYVKDGLFYEGKNVFQHTGDSVGYSSLGCFDMSLNTGSVTSISATSLEYLYGGTLYKYNPDDEYPFWSKEAEDKVFIWHDKNWVCFDKKENHYLDIVDGEHMYLPFKQLQADSRLLAKSLVPMLSFPKNYREMVKCYVVTKLEP